MLLLRECGGLHTGDDFSRPLPSDWLRLSGELQESMPEPRTQVLGLVARELLQSAKSPCSSSSSRAVRADDVSNIFFKKKNFKERIVAEIF